jgi:hypothetical protein
MNLKESGAIEIDGKELIEAKGLRPFLAPIVRRYSAARYFGNPLKIERSNHSTIAKPENKDVLQHQVLVKFLKDTISLPNLNEHETKLAIDLVKQLQTPEQIQKLQQHADALAAVRTALLATRKYLMARRNGANRSNTSEDELSKLWNEAANKIWIFDTTLGNACMVKGNGWADDSVWSKPEYQHLPLELDEILQYLMKTTAAHSV